MAKTFRSHPSIKYVNRIDQLIEVGNKIYEENFKVERKCIKDDLNGYNPDWDSVDPYILNENELNIFKWKQKCCHLLSQLPIQNTIYEETLKEIKNIKVERFALSSKLQEIIVSLEALKEDYQEGFLENLLFKAEAQVNTNYLKQAKDFLNDKHYAAAFFLATSVLEESLKIIYLNETGNEVTGKGLETAIAAVSDLELINTVTIKELQTWCHLRKKIAQGNLDSFNPDSEKVRQKVREVILTINILIQKYMG